MERGRRDITSSFVRALLRYLRRAAGPGVADDVLACAGIGAADPRLASQLSWFTAEELVALAEAAAERTGDVGIGRRLGEEIFRRDGALGNHDFLRAEGDPAAAAAFTVVHAGRMMPVRGFCVVERSDEELVVESSAPPGVGRHAVHCQMLAGYLVQVPELFGALGTVVETECLGRGGDRCRLVLRWDRAAASEAQVEASRHRSVELVHRLESVQQLAAEMATVDELGPALDTIVERAGSALLAQRFLLTIREHPDASPVILANGMSDDESAQLAAMLWHDGTEAMEVDDDSFGTRVVADVAAGDRHLGYLAAFLPPGATTYDFDARLLYGYAGHAAATIERIVASATARREHRNVRTLLNLAGALASARSVDEVIDLVTRTVSSVTECDVAGVWLLDETRAFYELQVVKEADRREGPRRFPVSDPSGPLALAADPRPFVISVGAEPAVDAVLEGWGLGASYVAPIVHRGELLGLLSAGSRRTIDASDHERHLEAVSALAHHAGTAIGNTLLFGQIRHQAMHDALTGLPNRPQIEERVAAAIDLAARLGTVVGVAFVDMDRFKLVNDTLGHVVGDVLISEVAQRLAQHVRPTDVVARLGGDEFLVLFPDLVSIEQAEEVVRRLLDGMQEPFDIDGETLFVTASAGVACYPDHGADYNALLAHADAAMYMAKGSGRNRLAVHRSAGPGPRSPLKLHRELHDAVARDELRVVFQPQVDLMTDEIVAAEALVRWQHPELGLIGPASFIALAEESGLIVDVDRWVRRSALTCAAGWRKGGTPVRVAVNVTRRDLSDSCLAGELQELLVELELPPDLVELEITDRIVMSDEDLPPSLAALRELGVRLAVDDFGTGSSVLSRLQSCPVDVLKVDRMFVEPLSHPRPDTRLVEGLVSMAQALGMEVVIEGIEDELQARAVRLLGADLGQGFHLHRPMPAEDLGQLLEQQRVQQRLPVMTAGIGRRSLRRVRR